ncbi:B12-binding domain-containing protein [Ilumatobacter sp.]|uniref:cobalamin B12-binding domain-containing protein n=1 Tax=Ilumatobacter sp. TaxID=1967498 RepID=UPI003C600F51
MPDDEQVDLQRAADALGVHYQTAYRWVRTGKLKAVLVEGRYLVGRDDIADLHVRRTAPRMPTAPGAKRMARVSDRVHEALVNGDEATVRRLAGTLVDEGASVIDVIQDVVVPPLVRIGDDWAAGRLTVALEHRASEIVERLLGELSPNPRGRRRGTVMVAAVSDELHSLPTSMAAVALRAENWSVWHLGANTPPDELVRFCSEQHVDLAVLSSTNPAAFALARDAADRLRHAGTPTVLGEPGRTLDDLIELARTAAGRRIDPSTGDGVADR